MPSPASRPEPQLEPRLEELVGRTEGLQPWRRAFHVVGGSCVAWVVYALSPQSPVTRWLFGILLAIAFVGDLVRLRSEAFNRFVYRAFRALMCPRELRRPSLTWFLLGVFLVLWLPAEGLAVPSLLVLALADPLASVVGRFWGTQPLGKGTVQGTTAFFAVALAVLTPFAGIAVALPVSAIVAAAEASSTRLDDNVVIPLVTGISLWAASGIG